MLAWDRVKVPQIALIITTTLLNVVLLNADLRYFYEIFAHSDTHLMHIFKL